MDNITPGLYRTRDGREAVVRAVVVDYDDDYPVEGEIGSESCFWKRNGRNGLYRQRPEDLVERIGDLPGADAPATAEEARAVADNILHAETQRQPPVVVSYNDPLREKLLVAAFGGPVANVALGSRPHVRDADVAGAMLVAMVDGALAAMKVQTT